MTSAKLEVIYWDTSAILSVLFVDRHSDTARKWVRKDGFHLISTLAYAETCAVIARMKREKHLTEPLVKAAFETLEQGPWRHLNAWPERKTTQTLSMKWSLRGADLWHLATAKDLQTQLAELYLLTFDTTLRKAAKGEGLGG